MQHFPHSFPMNPLVTQLLRSSVHLATTMMKLNSAQIFGRHSSVSRCSCLSPRVTLVGSCYVNNMRSPTDTQLQHSVRFGVNASSVFGVRSETGNWAFRASYIYIISGKRLHSSVLTQDKKKVMHPPTLKLPVATPICYNTLG